MGIDKDLAQGVVLTDPPVGIYGNVLEKPDHVADSIWMNPILRLFQAHHPAGARVQGESGEHEKTQGSIRKRAGGVKHAILAANLESQGFRSLIVSNAQLADVIAELG